jgi:hypothetical protein
VGVYLAYRNHSFLEQTDEHGIASWTLQQRDDLIAYLMGDSGTLAPYIIENQGPFAPGTTEKTIVRRDREIVTYTLKTVDIHGNPVPGVQFSKFLDDSQAYYTDENGFAQWEGMDVDNPCKVWGNQLPEGYVLDSFTREGNAFTALLRPIVTYTIKVVDENGNPMQNMHVRLISEQDSDSERTDANGEVRLKLGENSYTVKISNIFRMDDVDDHYDQIFQLPMGQTEATFVWVDETVTYTFKVVDKDGNLIAGLDIDVLMEQTNAASYPHEKTDKNGEAAIQAGLVKSTETPMEMMELSAETIALTESLLGKFNTASASDLGVGALTLRTAVQGAWLNVLINIGSLKDKELAENYRAKGQALVDQVVAAADRIYETVLTLV